VSKKLFLMRHAKSSWDDPKLDDHERPLTTRGRKAAAGMAGYIRDKKIAPDVILCTSAVRARETLELLRAELPNTPTVKIEPKLYPATSEDLLRRIRRLSPRASSVLVIGHNPAMQELVLSLASRGPELDSVRKKFPTSALAILEARVDRWGALAPEGAALVGFVTPKKLKG